MNNSLADNLPETPKSIAPIMCAEMYLFCPPRSIKRQQIEGLSPLYRTAPEYNG